MNASRISLLFPFSSLLVFCGLLVFVICTACEVEKNLETSVPLIIEIEDGLEDAEVLNLQDHLATIPGINPTSIEFISRQDALHRMRESYPGITSIEGQNPFLDVVLVSLSENQIAETRWTRYMNALRP